MKIGIVGLGSIGKRVYLPLYLENKEIRKIHVYGRKPEKLKADLEKYNLEIEHDFDQMLDKIDCLMVHSATKSHYELVYKALEKRIPVYVDKPLTDDIAQSNTLISLAKENNTLLFVGYNRRYAPLYLELKKMDLKPVKLYYEKHRSGVSQKESYEDAIIDDFIHLIDTVMDLNTNELQLRQVVLGKTKKNELTSLHVDLSSDTQINTLFTTRGSGNDYEKITIHAKDQIIEITDMRVLKVMKDNKTSYRKINERLSDSQIRGFENTLNTFFEQSNKNKYRENRAIDSEQICLDIINILNKK